MGTEDNEATPLQPKRYNVMYLTVLDLNWMLIAFKFLLSGTHNFSSTLGCK